MNINKIYADSFDTFKVFDNLDINQASLTNFNSPKSVWQILNHLIIWQACQLEKLQGVNTADIGETDTWLKDKNIDDQALLDDGIARFHQLNHQVKTEISGWTIETQDIEFKLKTVQELTVHLSFHLGEIILFLRQNGYYPMPDKMKSFLNENKLPIIKNQL
ncbi:hypothetical protein GVN16_12085 [Emticicia sp. CRIBPO]|uniref:hypothetical protein n=1 Tax=Emticicia sp. CRIBPO TaxID=2683258 RepID=UPI0014129A68|nr:hypothetical protein [Emticicia sp. CRIBPO]NBA86508.1 hypothetical protein [Emticicia sp. CRIBPO]